MNQFKYNEKHLKQSLGGRRQKTKLSVFHKHTGWWNHFVLVAEDPERTETREGCKFSFLVSYDIRTAKSHDAVRRWACHHMMTDVCVCVCVLALHLEGQIQTVGMSCGPALAWQTGYAKRERERERTTVFIVAEFIYQSGKMALDARLELFHEIKWC